jgi:predicted nucleic acid-binding protein
MRRRVIIDSGPIVALFDKDDLHHRRAVKFLRGFEGTLITTLPVVTEVVYLLDFNIRAQVDALRWIHDGAVTLENVTADDLGRVIELLEKYADLPADFADASLPAIAERLGMNEIATVDGDFAVYRLKGRKLLRNVFLA